MRHLPDEIGEDIDRRAYVLRSTVHDAYLTTDWTLAPYYQAARFYAPSPAILDEAETLYPDIHWVGPVIRNEEP